MMEEESLLRSIRILGSSNTLQGISAFQLNLKNGQGPQSYQWTLPPSREQPNTGRWQFLIDGTWSAKAAPDGEAR